MIGTGLFVGRGGELWGIRWLGLPGHQGDERGEGRFRRGEGIFEYMVLDEVCRGFTGMDWVCVGDRESVCCRV